MVKLPFEILGIDLDYASILELQAGMTEGKFSSRDLVFYYLTRIALFDQDGPHINSVIEINPDAIFIAEALDLERKEKGSRGSLHGIPILIKDNIETKDKMHTTAGALALQHNVAEKDAFLVKQLRKAGAVILGKTNLTEFANGVSMSMFAGYSSYGGQVKNPYGDFHPGGSSTGSGAAVAMNFAAAAIGTETTGSILSPSVQMSVVGLKPTVGLISRSGVIPFSYSQDTPGPMAKNVKDVAVVLESLIMQDEEDTATWRIPVSLTVPKYSDIFDENALSGARIGVFRDVPQEDIDSGEYNEALFIQTIENLKQAGADIVDYIDIPTYNGRWGWDKLNAEFKHGIDSYLNKQAKHNGIHHLSELIDWNNQHSEQALKYGQGEFINRSKRINPLKDKNYILDSVNDLYNAQNQGIDYALKTYNLDVILFPSVIGCDISARAGYPTLAVPAGYSQDGRPFGITFAGTAFSEFALLRIGYAFEHWTKHRKLPKLYSDA